MSQEKNNIRTLDAKANGLIVPADWKRHELYVYWLIFDCIYSIYIKLTSEQFMVLAGILSYIGLGWLMALLWEQ